jgi:hypothetical protein
LVISFHTAFISLAQNIPSQDDKPIAQKSITQRGTQADCANSFQAFLIVSTIAASGQIAFATSFDP